MTLRDYPTRVLLAASLSSLVIVGLTGSVAVFLLREQARMADIVGENIGSQRAAIRLKEVLTALAALHQQSVRDVAALHERVETHLADIARFADKDREVDLVHQINDSYRQYLALWARMRVRPGPVPELVRQLRDDTLVKCQNLQDFNATLIEQSQSEHRASLTRMTWGLAAVGGLGSAAGLVLGYGLARGLRRTIYHFLVRIQGAADLLRAEAATVEWDRDQDREPLRDGADDLLRRVEQAVVRLQQREWEVHRVERLATLGQLAAGVAHEIRNPLTSVLLLFQTARKDPSAGGLTDEDLDLIEQELHRIERSLQVFLDYARPPKLARETCRLGDIIQDALALAAGRIHQQRVTVSVALPDDPCPLDADREQLRQVILNLILNALEAMPQGGSLWLRVRPVPDGVIELTVEDSGPGIAAPILPRLFEPFATGQDTGLGLGLVISKRIVEEHGGTVSGSNRPTGGAAFVVRLPVQG